MYISINLNRGEIKMKHQPMRIKRFTLHTLQLMRNFVLDCAVDDDDFDYIQNFANDEEILDYVNSYYHGGVTQFILDSES